MMMLTVTVVLPLRPLLHKTQTRGERARPWRRSPNSLCDHTVLEERKRVPSPLSVYCALWLPSESLEQRKGGSLTVAWPGEHYLSQVSWLLLLMLTTPDEGPSLRNGVRQTDFTTLAFLLKPTPRWYHREDKHQTNPSQGHSTKYLTKTSQNYQQKQEKTEKLP